MTDATKTRASSRASQWRRATNNLLCYWRFCKNAKCARSRECRGAAWRCELHWRFLSQNEQHWYYRRTGRYDLL